MLPRRPPRVWEDCLCRGEEVPLGRGSSAGGRTRTSCCARTTSRVATTAAHCRSRHCRSEWMGSVGPVTLAPAARRHIVCFVLLTQDSARFSPSCFGHAGRRCAEGSESRRGLQPRRRARRRGPECRKSLLTAGSSRAWAPDRGRGNIFEQVSSSGTVSGPLHAMWGSMRAFGRLFRPCRLLASGP